MQQKFHFPFSLLSDPKAEVIGQFGLRHERGGPDGQDIALPAHVLINRDGTVSWSFVSPTVQKRARAAQDLEAIAKLAD